jgi:hypothetical protein
VVTKAKTFIKAAGGADDYDDDDEESGNGQGSLLGFAAACAAQTAESKLAYAVLPAVASGNGMEVDIAFELLSSGDSLARGQEGSSGSSVRAVLASTGSNGRGFRRGTRLTVRIMSIDLQRQKVYAQLHDA